MTQQTPTGVSNESLERALLAFLNDMGSLTKLESYLSNPNVFSVIDVTNKEIRHSNILAWLLDPNGTHGLGDFFLRRFFLAIAQRDEKSRKQVFRLVEQNVFFECRIRREWKNIDLFIIFRSINWVVCIENKINAKDSPGQLDRYVKNVNREFGEKKWQKTFVYLTLHEEGPRNAKQPDYWILLGYYPILQIVSESLSHELIRSNTRFILEQYQSMLQDLVMDNSELSKLAASIYREHKAALDFIFDNSATDQAERGESCIKWCREKTETAEIVFLEHFGSSRIIRFSTKQLEELFPRLSGEKKSLWKNEIVAAFEILNSPNSVRMQIAVSSVGLSENGIRAVKSFLGMKKGKGRRTKYQPGIDRFYVIATRSSHKMDDFFTEDDRKQLSQQLNSDLKELCNTVETVLEKESIHSGGQTTR